MLVIVYLLFVKKMLFKNYTSSNIIKRNGIIITRNYIGILCTNINYNNNKNNKNNDNKTKYNIINNNIVIISLDSIAFNNLYVCL